MPARGHRAVHTGIAITTNFIHDASQTPQWVSEHVTRCSCSFCIFGARADLHRTAEIRPGLYRAYAHLEQRIGHTHSPAHILLPELTGVPFEPTSGARHYGTARLAHRIVPFGGPQGCNPRPCSEAARAFENPSATHHSPRCAGSGSPAREGRGPRRGGASSLHPGDLSTSERPMRIYARDDACGFRFSRAAWGASSNFQPLAVPIAAGPWLFSSSENLYQAAKFGARPDIQQRIAEAPTARDAAAIGRTPGLDIDPGWNVQRVDVMRWVLRMKRETNPAEIDAELAATGPSSRSPRATPGGGRGRSASATRE